MKKRMIIRSTCLFSLMLIVLHFSSFPQTKTKTSSTVIIVDASGKGNFTSIQAALNSLPDSAAATRIILIKNGVYNEKIFIEKSNIILKGEDRGKTIITQAIARDEWRCLHRDDWGVATMNMNGNDITLMNLTVTNTYGFDFEKKVSKKNTHGSDMPENIIIHCPSDTVANEKTIRKDGHQMALRTMNTTRLKAINCRFSAFGGDTVSPWNVQDGLFYFKDCIMEGGVDFYCPRGWAYAEGCRFISHTGPAAIWHDGSVNLDSKTVLKNCSFEGFDGFNLGRYHKDAQFYLINCTFAQNMANKDIYIVATTNTIQWGRRVYYYNCHKKGGDYAWHKDNLTIAQGVPKASDINALWTFNGKWKNFNPNP